MLDHQLKWPGIYDAEIHNNSNGIVEQSHSDSESASNDDEDDVYEDAEDGQVTECWLIPQDPNSVNTMYQAMTDCQALHPDSGDSISGDSEYMEEENEDDVEVPVLGENDTIEEARNTINNMSLNDDQFADADE